MNNPKQVAFNLDGTADQPDFTNTYTINNEDRVAVGPPSLLGEAERRQDLAIEDAREDSLREIAATYHERCDMFDAMIAPKGEPRTDAERRAMQLHAANVKAELLGRVTVDERSSLRYYITELGRVNK